MLSLLLTTALRPWWMCCTATTYRAGWGQGALLISLVLGLASAAWSLSDGATQLVDSLPVAPKGARQPQGARGRQQPAGHRAEGGHPDRAGRHREQHHQPTRRGVQRVVVERPPFNVRD